MDDAFFEGASLLHLLADLDPHHPAVTRLLERLGKTKISPEMLEMFAKIPRLCGDAFPEVVKHSPLMCAVFAGNYVVTKWLLALGADPNSASGEKMRTRPYSRRPSWPIVRAAMHKDSGVLRLLLKRGASVHVARRPASDRSSSEDPKLENVGFVAPLHMAAYHRRFENVRLLVLHGANFHEEGDFCDDAFNVSSPVKSMPPRDFVRKGVRDALATRRRWLSRSWEPTIPCALDEYDSAVREALEKRRLLVLGCLRASCQGSIPGHLLRGIFERASLFY